MPVAELQRFHAFGPCLRGEMAIEGGKGTKESLENKLTLDIMRLNPLICLIRNFKTFKKTFCLESLTSHQQLVFSLSRGILSHAAAEADMSQCLLVVRVGNAPDGVQCLDSK